MARKIQLIAICFTIVMILISCGISSSGKKTTSTENMQETSQIGLGTGFTSFDSAQMNKAEFTMLFKRATRNTEQDIIDKASVTELVETERFYRDNAMWQEMKKCYATNSTVTVSWFHGTGAEFVDASSKMNSISAHKIYNTLVWLNSNKAVSITMATIQLRTSIDGCPAELNSDVKLLYRTQKMDGVWYIVSLDAIYDKDSLIPVYPNNNIVIPIDEISKLRPSYANLAYVLGKQGLKVSTDLPGMDKPVKVNKLYKEADSWLCKE